MTKIDQLRRAAGHLHRAEELLEDVQEISAWADVFKIRGMIEAAADRAAGHEYRAKLIAENEEQ